jgi:hypothetical protein
MPIPRQTATGEPPTSPDGRSYPDHLRPYERLDGDLLPIVQDLQPVSFDTLSAAVRDVRQRAALPRWLASAQWRGLLERETPSTGSRAYSLAERAGAAEPAASRRHRAR